MKHIFYTTHTPKLSKNWGRVVKKRLNLYDGFLKAFHITVDTPLFWVFKLFMNQIQTFYKNKC